MTKRIRKPDIKEGVSQLSKIKVSNIIYPIIFGLGVVFYMIYKDFDAELFRSITFTWNSVFWLLIAFFFMFGRDFGYMIRLRIFSDNRLSWYECFRIIMLWEFTSAITPSAIGGTSVAIVYVHKGGLSIGKSSAIVLLTSFFDELYFAVMFPLLFLLIGKSELFTILNSSGEISKVASGLFTIALAGYGLKLLYLLFVSYGLFINPRGLKWLIVTIFKIKFLRKWRLEAAKTGDDIIVSSKELKQKSIVFWIKSFAATFLSWSSRYLVVNAMLLAFFNVNDHVLLFGRQLVMWIMMLIMPTPGGSGFSEFLFKEYLGEFAPIAGIAILLALIWRMITYYPYLVIGAILFPRWLKEKFSKSRKIKRAQK